MPPAIQTPEHKPWHELPEHASKDRKSLAIAFLVAVLFLLAAIGIATWLFVQKQNNPEQVIKIGQPDPKDTSYVTKVAWVAPALPASFTAFNHSTPSGTAVYYADMAGGCAITTRIVAAAENNQEMLLKANDASGVVTTTSAKADDVTIADAEGGQQYAFSSVSSSQNVDAPATNITKQSSIMSYKQFGEQVAAIAFACKQDVMAAKTDELAALVKQFKVKTER